jgi:hypothetical protein
MPPLSNTETAFLFSLYVDDVHTSQGTQVWASTARYGDNFTFYLTTRLYGGISQKAVILRQNTLEPESGAVQQ